MKKVWKDASNLALCLMQYWIYDMGISLSTTGEGYILYTKMGGQPDKVSSPFKNGEGFYRAFEQLLEHSVEEELAEIRERYQLLISGTISDDGYGTVYDDMDWCEAADYFLTDLLKCRPANIRVDYVYKMKKREESED